MGRKWVVNASPLIVLTKIGQLSLLLELCNQMVIPAGVANEINEGPDDDAARIWLKDEGGRFVQNVGAINPVVAKWDLGAGETEVLSWALDHPEYEAIVDDRAAKNCASSLDIKVRGTIGIILLGKRHQKLDQIDPILDQLVESGFRIDQEVISAAKKLAGEHNS